MIDNVERLLGFAEACRKQMQEPNMSDGDKAMLEIDAERHEAAAEEIQQLRARCEELDSLNDIDLAARDDLIQKLRAEVAALKKDAERLDWIESVARQKQVQIAQSLLKTGYEIAVGMSVAVHHGSLREALDAALGGEKTS